MVERGFCRLCQQAPVLGQFVSDDEFRCAACVDEHGKQPGSECLRHPSRNDAFGDHKRPLEEASSADGDEHPASHEQPGKRVCASNGRSFSTPSGRRVLQHLMLMKGEK